MCSKDFKIYLILHTLAFGFVVNQHHLHRTPPVKGDSPDVVHLAQFLDEGFDEGVVDHIAFGGMECIDNCIVRNKVS